VEICGSAAPYLDVKGPTMQAVQYRTIGAAPEVVEIETRTRGCTKVR